VSEPETSPYCISSRVAFVSVLTPDRFPSLLPFVSSARLSFASPPLSSGMRSHVKFGDGATKGDYVRSYGTRHVLSLSLSLVFSLPLRASSSQILSTCREKSHACAFFRSNSASFVFERSTLQFDCRTVSRFVDSPSFERLFISSVCNGKLPVFRVPCLVSEIFHRFTFNRPPADGSFLGWPSEKRKHALGTRISGLRRANGIIPYFSIKRGK